MRIPSFLCPNHTIGFCAPSFGIAIEPYLTRYEEAKATFRHLGYRIKETPSVHHFQLGQSASKEVRAKEFESLWFDLEVDFIFSVAGGERMIEIIPYLHFEEMAKSTPKFFMGYSDNTSLTFLLTTICDTASIYGQCAPEFGMSPWDKSLQSAYELITGSNLLQHSFRHYQIEELNNVPGHELDGYHLTEPVVWKNLRNETSITLKGRLIGGCLDVLMLFAGTPYDNVSKFTERYRHDGILWYLETCDLNVMSTMRALWQLKQAGWFMHCQGFIFGRPKNHEPLFDVTYRDAVESILGDLDVPIILDADIGHVPPTLTLVNGAYVKIISSNGSGTLETLLK